MLSESFYCQIHSITKFVLAPDSIYTDEIHSIARIWKCKAIEMQWPRIIDALYYHRVDWMEIQTGSKHCNCAEVIWNENTFHWRRCFFFSLYVGCSYRRIRFDLYTRPYRCSYSNISTPLKSDSLLFRLKYMIFHYEREHFFKWLSTLNSTT